MKLNYVTFMPPKPLGFTAELLKQTFSEIYSSQHAIVKKSTCYIHGENIITQGSGTTPPWRPKGNFPGAIACLVWSVASSEKTQRISMKVGCCGGRFWLCSHRFISLTQRNVKMERFFCVDSFSTYVQLNACLINAWPWLIGKMMTPLSYAHTTISETKHGGILPNLS